MHGATFLRRRQMYLDASLLDTRWEFRRIVTHELFHFAWARASNPSRLNWEQLLVREWRQGARGELGWSSEWRKAELRGKDVQRRTSQWREYICESFCDTAAWALSGVPRHGEFTLAPRFRARRAEWLVALVKERGIRI